MFVTIVEPVLVYYWLKSIVCTRVHSLCCSFTDFEKCISCSTTVPAWTYSVASVMSTSLLSINCSPPASSVHGSMDSHFSMSGLLCLPPGALPSPKIKLCRQTVYHWAPGEAPEHYRVTQTISLPWKFCTAPIHSSSLETTGAFNIFIVFASSKMPYGNATHSLFSYAFSDHLCSLNNMHLRFLCFFITW